MKLRTLSALAGLVFGAAQAGAALNWEYFVGGDAGFNVLSTNGALERAVTEGRIGNNATSGTWERAIWQQGGVGLPQQQGQFAWTNGTAVPFSIVYDGANSLTYTLGGQSLTWNGLAGPFTDIFIRTRAGLNSTIALSSLDLVGSGLSIGNLTSSGENDVDYIRITNMGMNFPAFELNGAATLSWTGGAPTNSALAYQVKLTNVIPEPTTLALALGGALTLFRRRR